MQDWPERERYTAEDLLQIIRILRDRENGCPWDKVQTHASIRKNFLEETCEALEAIDADDAAMMREELVFRHPNIFASSAAENAGINSWDALKNKEKGRTTLADELNTVPATLPALMYAQKMQKRAARKGAFAQTAEDAAAALKAAERGWEEAVPENAAERAGALLFAAANAMRLAGVDAEEALTFASGRFRQELLQKTEDSDGQERPATV